MILELLKTKSKTIYLICFHNKTSVTLKIDNENLKVNATLDIDSKNGQTMLKNFDSEHKISVLLKEPIEIKDTFIILSVW